MILAFPHFWRHGYHGTSVDDLVRVTGASRHALYQSISGKRALFVFCLEAYREAIVTPAFARVERPGADFADIAAFFDHQIAAAATAGLPGPGCLFANTMTELAPHDAEIAALVRAHHDRLSAGFCNALMTEAGRLGPVDPAAIAELAAFLSVSAQGLWSFSRTIDDADLLRRSAATAIDLARRRLER